MGKKQINSSRMPVYRDAGFELYDASTTKEAFSKETENERIPELYIYSRYRNPTVTAAEDEIMKLEKCEWALLTQSGMSAIDTALSVFQRGSATRPWLFFSEIYGGTISYTESVLKGRRGLRVHSFFPSGEKYDIQAFTRIMAETAPEIVYVEIISNPMLIVTDIRNVIDTAHSHGAKVIVDNTFATPILCRPLDLGADMVIHSATKYFSGHGNITAGVVCGNDQSLMKQAIEYRKFVGHMISPDDAYRLTTQIQTFPLRFRQQCMNAEMITNLMKSHPSVGKIWYPGLKSHPTHDEAVKLFGAGGFGAMVTVDFAGKTNEEKKNNRDKFIKSVSDEIKVIPSLGDPKTIIMPVEPVWGAKYPEPGIIRISAGFEDTSDLEVTIKKALEEAAGN
ncbi:MAG TPA: PLP-dependent aspartate aminotransferase family protein [Bacteroidales bacterium]|jgi:cystathionine beta-lyase/cystathionine gamma-synthase|nr:PLP-dependent aspartate aminotransferase family protein [Bacteroidales bacterium]